MNEQTENTVVDNTDATEEEETSNIVNGKKFKYFFKSSTVKNEKGEEIGKTRKHPDVQAILPVPTVENIINYLNSIGATGEDGKETATSKAGSMVVEAVQDMIFQAGRAQINDWLEKNPEGTFTPTQFDHNILNLEYLATLPKGQRGAWAPSEEDLKDFCEDYTEVYVGVVGYDAKKVKVHCEQFLNGFRKIKSDKIALAKMLDFLEVWVSNKDEESLPAFEQTYTWLHERCTKYLNAEEKNFAEAL